MNNKNKVCLVTYTNSVMQDVWPFYFGQVDEYLDKSIKSYAFSNLDEDSFKTKFFVYDNSDPYYKQYLDCLKNVKEDFLIYAQEDFFLYHDVDYKKILELANILEKSNYDYIRLIRSGYASPLLDSELGDNLYEVDMNSNDAFTMQATLWKKSKLISLYDKCKSEKWLESKDWNNSCRQLGIRGLFYYNGEKQVGKFHYECKIFPYTCTGINKGQWNVNEYGEFLHKMFKKYNIDPEQRGMRLGYNTWTK
jgi:hypothetical protein